MSLCAIKICESIWHETFLTVYYFWLKWQNFLQFSISQCLLVWLYSLLKSYMKPEIWANLAMPRMRRIAAIRIDWSLGVLEKERQLYRAFPESTRVHRRFCGKSRKWERPANGTELAPMVEAGHGNVVDLISESMTIGSKTIPRSRAEEKNCMRETVWREFV